MEFLSNFLSFAAETGTVDPNASGAELAAGNWIAMLFPLLLLGLFYVILIVPQKRKEKKHREALASAIVGDQMVTIGGIAGKIVNIKDDEITFETSIERTKITVKKWAIKDIIKPIQS